MALKNGAHNLALQVGGNNESTEPLQLRTGMVIAFTKATSPWTATVRLSDTDISGITMQGWYDPVVGDKVQVLEQGPSRFIIGTVAPGKVYMPASPPPAPPAPPPPPAAPPTIREVSIEATASYTYPAEAPQNGTRSDLLYQGGLAVLQRSFWIYGTKIATEKGAGTILSGKIFIRRYWTAHGSGSKANVRLGSHGFTAQPGTSPAHSNVTVVGGLNRDEGGGFDIPASIISAMNAGTAKGLGLEPGASGYVTPDYMIAYAYGSGREWSGSLSLVIQG